MARRNVVAYVPIFQNLPRCGATLGSSPLISSLRRARRRQRGYITQHTNSISAHQRLPCTPIGLHGNPAYIGVLARHVGLRMKDSNRKADSANILATGARSPYGPDLRMPLPPSHSAISSDRRARMARGSHTAAHNDSAISRCLLHCVYSKSR